MCFHVDDKITWLVFLLIQSIDEEPKIKIVILSVSSFHDNRYENEHGTWN